MLIKPITVRIVAYGQKANVANIRTRAAAVLDEEHGQVDPAAFVELSAKDAHAEITAERWDAEVVLRKPTPGQAGLAVTLAEVNERMMTEWLYELPVAKTCVAFASWISPREQLLWHLLVAEGHRTSESRKQEG